MSDNKRPHPLGFVINPDGTLSGPLPGGFLAEGVTHDTFTMRAADVGDLLDAELESDVTRPLGFNAALMVRQLVRVGTFEGPFTLNMIRRLKPKAWRQLRAAQSELDALGEGEPAIAPAS